ncbi:MAG: hypothetical protein CMF39_01915 [Legionellaceae bacterium]|nr:hypothetical protein [Legionellaceae bacterium]
MSKITADGADQAPKIERKKKQHENDKKAGRAKVLDPEKYNALKANVDKLRAAFPGRVKFSRQDEHTLATGEVIELHASVIIDESKPDGFKVLLDTIGEPGSYGRPKATVFRNAEYALDQSEIVKISKPSQDVSAKEVMRTGANEHEIVKQIDGINSPLVERQDAQGELMLYMSMKKRQGKDVCDSYLEPDFHQLKASELIAVLQAIHRAVQSFHEKGFIHRDIKPENIMLHRDEHGQFHADLIDFGYVRKVGVDIDNDDGTAHYKHPDLGLDHQGSGNHKTVGKWIDLHALAGVFGFILFRIRKNGYSACLEENYQGRGGQFSRYNFKHNFYWSCLEGAKRDLLVVLMRQLEGRKKGHEDELSHEQIAACLSLIQLFIACQTALDTQKASDNPSEQLEVLPVEPAEFARIKSLINDDARLNGKPLKTAFNNIANKISMLTQQVTSDQVLGDGDGISRASPADSDSSPVPSSPERFPSPEGMLPLERSAPQYAQVNFIAATFAAFATMLKNIASAISTALCYLCPEPQVYDQKPVLGGGVALFSEQAFCLTGSPEHLMQITCCS